MPYTDPFRQSLSLLGSFWPCFHQRKQIHRRTGLSRGSSVVFEDLFILFPDVTHYFFFIFSQSVIVWNVSLSSPFHIPDLMPRQRLNMRCFNHLMSKLVPVLFC